MDGRKGGGRTGREREGGSRGAGRDRKEEGEQGEIGRKKGESGEIGRERDEGQEGRDRDAGQEGRESGMRGRREGPREGTERDGSRWICKKEERKRPGEKVMERESTINQNSSRQYLHCLLHEEEAIERKREAPAEEGRSRKIQWKMT
jgi:hypothetical protein